MGISEFKIFGGGFCIPLPKEKVMEQVAVIKVHFLAGKTVKDAMELLQMPFGDQALKKT